MHPDDQVDALLSQRLGELPAASPSPPNPRDAESFDSELEAAARLGPLRDAAPLPGFADRLEQRLLALADTQRERTMPGRELARTSGQQSAAPAPRLLRPIPGRQRLARLVWPAVAAALVLLATTGVFSGAAAAGPGSPLYGLHRWEQGISADLSANPADQVRLHLRFARDSLRAAGGATSPTLDAQAFHDAVQTFNDEQRAASAGLGLLREGAERDSLTRQLSDLQATARTDLRAWLFALDWTARVFTTGVLGDIGDQGLPHITDVSILRISHDGNYIWYCTAHGSGFAPGAVMLIDGRQMGVIASYSPTTVSAELSVSRSVALPTSIGVGNPDGTAAATSNLTSQVGNDDDLQPTPQATDTSHDGSGSGDEGGGSGSDGSGSGGHDGSSGTPSGGSGTSGETSGSGH